MSNDIDIDQMTEEELVALNHRIVERLKFLDTVQAHRDMMAFNIGARAASTHPGTVVCSIRWSSPTARRSRWSQTTGNVGTSHRTCSRQ